MVIQSKSIMLKEQFRMNELIMKWSNSKFYKNELRANKKCRDWKLEDDSELGDVLIFYDTCGFDMFESVEGGTVGGSEGNNMSFTINV